jgi:hypothetical protein
MGLTHPPLSTEKGVQGGVPAGSHSLGLPPLEQGTGVHRVPTMKGRCHHPWQPGLMHAVYHPVSLINHLQEAGARVGWRHLLRSILSSKPGFRVGSLPESAAVGD